jgi:hypothetical protein
MRSLGLHHETAGAHSRVCSPGAHAGHAMGGRRGAARQVRLLLLAALAGEHILYLGPPGTAKSELGRRLAQLYDGPFFERLLTRFSVPEELFGPLSMRELENDRYVRQVCPARAQSAARLPRGSVRRQRGLLPALSQRCWGQAACLAQLRTSVPGQARVAADSSTCARRPRCMRRPGPSGAARCAGLVRARAHDASA